jgi:hypothetical protein
VIPAVAAGACGGAAGEWSKAAAFAFALRSVRSPFACDASSAKLQPWGGGVSARRASWAGGGLACAPCTEVNPHPADGRMMRP